jgi:hypothetical protein
MDISMDISMGISRNIYTLASLGQGNPQLKRGTLRKALGKLFPTRIFTNGPKNSTRISTNIYKKHIIPTRIFATPHNSNKDFRQPPKSQQGFSTRPANPSRAVGNPHKAYGFPSPVRANAWRSSSNCIVPPTFFNCRGSGGDSSDWMISKRGAQAFTVTNFCALAAPGFLLHDFSSMILPP